MAETYLTTASVSRAFKQNFIDELRRDLQASNEHFLHMAANRQLFGARDTVLDDKQRRQWQRTKEKVHG